MSVESAEMTKHAINAFLATSVTFINEMAALCEQVGADAKEVERGLKTEPRIGPDARTCRPAPRLPAARSRATSSFLRELGPRIGRADAAHGRRVESSNARIAVGAAPAGVSCSAIARRDDASRSGG